MVAEKYAFETYVDDFIEEDMPGLLLEYQVGQNQTLGQKEGTKLFNAEVIHHQHTSMTTRLVTRPCPH